MSEENNTNAPKPEQPAQPTVQNSEQIQNSQNPEQPTQNSATTTPQQAAPQKQQMQASATQLQQAQPQAQQAQPQAPTQEQVQAQPHQPQQQQTPPQQQQASAPIQGQPQMQGQPSAGAIKYAGFWIRFIAVIIDSIIIGLGLYVIQAVTGLPLIVTEFSSESGQASANSTWMGTVLHIIYMTVTTGSKLQGTIGKKILGLKVIRADGSKITYLRAFGRFWATILSYLTLSIGFIMAGFTKEKKALHDMVANTRVVYAKSIK